jgi:hypothetical protein
VGNIAGGDENCLMGESVRDRMEEIDIDGSIQLK